MKYFPLIVVIALLAIAGGAVWYLNYEETPEPPRVAKKVEEEPKETPTRPSPSRSSGLGASASSTSLSPPPVAIESKPSTASAAAPAETVNVRGVVRDRQGGIPGVAVLLLNADAPSEILAEATTSSESEDEGHFVFSRPVSSQRALVAFVEDGWGVTASKPFALGDSKGDSEAAGVAAEKLPALVELDVPDAAALVATVNEFGFPSGDPLEGATVEVKGDALLSALLGLAAKRANRVMVSDAKGEVRIQGVPPGTHLFAATKASYSTPPEVFGAKASARITFKAGNDQKDTFTLTKSGSVRGIAISEVTGLPIVAAQVVLSLQIGNISQTVFTDSEGVFLFPIVAADADITERMANREGGGEGRRGRGRGRAAEEQPTPDRSESGTGATPPSEGPREPARGGDGIANEVAYRIDVLAPGVGVGEKTGISVRSGQTTDVGNVLVKVGGVLYGVVKDSKGNPIEGAEVSLGRGGGLNQFARILGAGSTKSPFRAVSGPDGSYKIDPVAAQQPTPAPATPEEGGRGRRMRDMFASPEVTASAEGFAPKSDRLRPAIQPAEKREMNFELVRSGGVFGVVTDDGGRPISGVSMSAEADTGGSGGGMGRSFERIIGRMMGGGGASENLTDENGRYEIKGITPGKVRITATHSKFQETSVGGIDVIEDSMTESNITMVGGGIIYGTYYDENDRPKSGMSVVVMSLDPFALNNTTTDGSGRYEVSGLQPGLYTVKASAAGVGGMEDFGRQFQDINPADRVKVEMGVRTEHNIYENTPGTVTLRGRVTLDGEPYVGDLTLGGGGFSGVTAKPVTVDQDGKYEVRNLQPGGYAFMLGGMMGGRGRGLSLLQQVRVIVERQPPIQEKDIEFLTVKVTGKVVMADNSALPADTVVFANPREERDARGLTSAWEQVQSQFVEQKRPDARTGVFEIGNLAPGWYYVTARSATGGFKRVGPLNLTRSVEGIQIELDRAVGSIKGTVENFVPPDEEGNMLAQFQRFGSIQIEDRDGSVLAVGSLSGNPMMPDNGIQLREDPTTGKIEFERSGLPVGTWTVVFQVSNYAPVRLANVTIGADLVTPLTFTLAAAGDVEIQITNNDLDAGAAQDLRYEIRDSRNQVFNKRFTFADLMVNMFSPPDPAKKNTFVLKDFPPDSYTFTFHLPGHKPATAKVVVASKQVSPMRVTFERE